MTIINSKTIARIAAIQAIYQAGLQSFDVDMDTICKKVIDYYKSEHINEDLENEDKSIKIKLHKNFFLEICDQLKSNLDQIDKIIIAHLSKDWTFSNMHESMKTIIRCGVTELLYFPEIPSKVVVNEYTNLGSDMLKEQEVGFINSILDTISKEARNSVKK